MDFDSFELNIHRVSLGDITDPPLDNEDQRGYLLNDAVGPKPVGKTIPSSRCPLETNDIPAEVGHSGRKGTGDAAPSPGKSIGANRRVNPITYREIRRF